MKKVLQVLLLGVLATSMSAVQANKMETFSGKTFFAPRTLLNNTAWMNTNMQKMMMDEDKFGANFQASAFYASSNVERSRKGLGHYFGTPVVVSDAAQSDSNINDDAIFRSDKTMSADIAPYRQVWGANLSYNQRLDKVLEGLYFSVQAPIAQARHTLLKDRKVTANVGAFDYFTGTASDKANALTSAKFYSGYKEKTALADIKAAVGYEVVKSDKVHVGLEATLMIPVGNKVTGEFVFEPVLGFGADHWAFGAGLHSGFKLYEGHESALDLMVGLDYQYVMSADQVRTAKAKDKSFYGMLAKAADTSATPAANVLTQAVKVEKGSMFDGCATLCYNHGDFNFDLGYNFFAREAETVKAKDASKAIGYSSAEARGTDATYANHLVADSAVVAADIDYAVAAAPRLISNKVFGSAGYTFDMEAPVGLSIGGSYEWAYENSGTSGYEFWFKAGVSF